MKIRAGAIIPLGGVIQNTTEYSLDSLTLIVSLDKNGKASGTLYEDAGDGFQYQKGEYLVSAFNAKKVGSSVNIEISAKEGKLKLKSRKYKVIIVNSNKVIESAWISRNKITVKLPAK